MIDQSHVDTFIVYQSAPFTYAAHAQSLDIDAVYDVIQTTLGNELDFLLKSVKFNDDNYLVAEYHQIDSPFVLFLYFDQE